MLSLAGLILTDDDESGVGRAALSVAGQTLIEYQVRIARACGADHIVVLVDRIPAPLVSAFDRLRADGINVDIARDAREVADRIHPDECLLVIAGGVVASRSLVKSLCKTEALTVMTLPDAPENAQFERIDGLDRWAGLALLNGTLLRNTAALLGDWTLGPTLLRTALQAGAGRMRCDDGGLMLVRNEKDAGRFAHVLARGSDTIGIGFWQSQVVDPLVARVLPQLVGRNVPLELVSIAPLVLMGTAMLAAALGWISASFGLYLLAGFPAAAGKIMADIAARPDRVLRWTAEAKLPMLIALMGFAGWTLDGPGLGWGPLVLALWAGIALVLQPQSDPHEGWHADADLIALELLMASLIGQPVLGLMIAVAHAVITQFWLVRRVR